MRAPPGSRARAISSLGALGVLARRRSTARRRPGGCPRAGDSAMSTMLTPAPPERERDLGDHARAGWAPTRAARAPGRRPGPRRAARRGRARARSFQARHGRRVAGRERRAHLARAAPTNSSIAGDQRVAVGRCRCPSRSRCWRRRRASRRGSSGRPPAGAERSRRSSAPAACATSTLASTCGRCETHGHQAVVRLGVDRRRAARRASSAGGAGARSSTPAVLRAPASGTRWRRRTGPRARARRPAVSAPASGWPPMKRSSAPASASTRLVEPTSRDHAVRPGARASAARTGLRERADRRGDEHDVGVRARASATSRRRAVDRAELERRVEHARRRGRSRGPRAPARRRAASPIEPPISPTPTTATFKTCTAIRRR